MKRFLSLILVLFLVCFPSDIHAVECDGAPPTGADNLSQIQEYINKCQTKINELKVEQTTLKQAISTINSKIYLAQAQINQTQSQIDLLEKEITVLSGVLTTVNQSMGDLSKIYLARVRESYRRSRTNQSDLVFASQSFADYFSKIKYLNTVKAKDQIILRELESSRLDYDQRKQAKVTKQKDVEKLKAKLVTQKTALDTQQKEKQNLLVITASDEKKFQALLAKARAELEAIEAVIAGKGSETEVKDVKAGEKIATVIPGASCNSGGEHLHFIVSKNKDVLNPFSFLKGVDYENCSGSKCGSSDGDNFNATGSWEWPINPKITMNQGFGVTWAVNHTWVGSIYKFHNGIDINSDSPDVKAVKDGKLFRGSYSGKNSCALKYVRVHHAEGEYDTYYLHVNFF